MVTPEQVNVLWDRILGVREDFDIMMFINDVLLQLSELSRDEQIIHIRKCLKRYLPKDFWLILKIFNESLPQKGEIDGNLWYDIYESYAEFINHFSDTLGDYNDEGMAIIEHIKKL